jgi:UDP-N-acetylmuramoyl-tripeptide--D-alanyl-D-alanine ligase
VIPLELDVLAGLGRLDGDADVVTGVQIDSRLVSTGDLFVAVGRGSEFLDDARANGAAATLVPDDAFAAMAAIGRLVRSRSKARVVGITGSVGKTSTKDILAALLRPHMRVVAAEGGHNNELGVPLTLCRIERDTEVVVLELAMRGLGQIAELAAIGRPHVGVVTNIAPVHIELLGSLDNVRRAKAELLEALLPGGVAIVPSDEPALSQYVPEGVELRRFDQLQVTQAAEGTRVSFHERDVEFSRMPSHQAANASAALLALEVLGVPLPSSRVDVEFSRWRCEESELPGGGLLINDAWNANPVAMRAALAHLHERAAGRRTVAVLGSMAELGPDAAIYHEEIGRLAKNVDVVIGVGELARGYDADEWVATAAEAVTVVREQVQPGDVVLVKGSRAVGLEVVADGLVGAPAQ